MNAFLNPIQFSLAAQEARVSAATARQLYRDAAQALAEMPYEQVKERGVAKPLPARTIPAAARSPLREALERQNADRAAAIEVEVIPRVAVTFCSGIIAAIRVSASSTDSSSPTD